MSTLFLTHKYSFYLKHGFVGDTVKR